MAKTKEEIITDTLIKMRGMSVDGSKRRILSEAMSEYAKQEAIEFFLDTTGGYMFKDNAEQLYQQYLLSKTK